MKKKVKGGKEAPWMEHDAFRRFECAFYKDEKYILRKPKGRNGS